jgi:hypothetical protein
VYADAALPVDHGLMARAAALVIPATAAITGRSAAWLWGARIAGPDDAVDVVVTPRHRPGPINGLRVRVCELESDETAIAAGTRITLPLRTAWEVAMRDDVENAVVVLDALAAAGRVSGPELARYVAARRGRRGWRIAEGVFGLVDGRSESPQESRLRIRLRLAGLPPPTPQYVVRSDDGQFIARVDLAWPEAKVAVEYDGQWHAEPGQLARDRRRLNALLAHGWCVHHVTARDMHDIPATASAISRLLSR